MIVSTLVAATVAASQPAPAQPMAGAAPAADKKMTCCEKMAKGEGCGCCKDMGKEGHGEHGTSDGGDSPGEAH